MEAKIFPRKTGDIFASPGGTLYIAIAPCCMVYDRGTETRWNRKGKQIIPAKVWIEALKYWDNFETRYLHYPLHRLFPTWLCKKYSGGTAHNYIGGVEGSFVTTLWWIKNYPLSLKYQPFIEIHSNLTSDSALEKAA